jgi:pilus assembly protein Flp/PilA
MLHSKRSRGDGIMKQTRQRQWHKKTKGAALIEYGILVGLIAVLAIVAVTRLGGTTKDTFRFVSDTLSSSIASAVTGTTGNAATTTLTPSGPAPMVGSFTMIAGETGWPGYYQWGYREGSIGSYTNVDLPNDIRDMFISTSSNEYFINIYGDLETELSTRSITCNSVTHNFSDAFMVTYNSSLDITQYRFSGSIFNTTNGTTWNCSIS